MALLFRVQSKDEEQSFIFQPFFGKMPFLILTRKSMLLKSPSKKNAKTKKGNRYFLTQKLTYCNRTEMKVDGILNGRKYLSVKTRILNMIFLFSIDKIWVETNFSFPSKPIHSSKFNKLCLHGKSNRENAKLGNRDIKKMKTDINFSLFCLNVAV